MELNRGDGCNFQQTQAKNCYRQGFCQTIKKPSSHFFTPDIVRDNGVVGSKDNSCLITLTLCSIGSNKQLPEMGPEGLQGLTDAGVSGWRLVLADLFGQPETKTTAGVGVEGVAVKG